jgi:hypothetical protein
VAQNALSVIQTHYGEHGDLRSYLAPDFFDPIGFPATFIPNAGNANSVLKASGVLNPFTLQALPGFTNIPPFERAYQFGNATPFPAKSPAACTYFWTALIRLSPSYRTVSVATNNVLPSSTYNYDVFILVFRKGAPEHHFSNMPPAASLPNGATYTEVPYTRNLSDPIVDESLIPSVGYAAWMPGSIPGGDTAVRNALPPMGQYGIGAYSGTVFRQVLDPLTYTSAVPRPQIIGAPTIEPVIYCPAADGTANSASPLIYVYQTSVSF